MFTTNIFDFLQLNCYFYLFVDWVIYKQVNRGLFFFKYLKVYAQFANSFAPPQFTQCYQFYFYVRVRPHDWHPNYLYCVVYYTSSEKYFWALSLHSPSPFALTYVRSKRPDRIEYMYIPVIFTSIALFVFTSEQYDCLWISLETLELLDFSQFDIYTWSRIQLYSWHIYQLNW